MKKVLYIIIFSVYCICLSACSTNDEANDTKIEEPIALEAEQINNITYGNDSDQVYDLYLPADRNTETKIVILVHGGGYTSGDKKDMNAFQEYLKGQLPNLAIANMNYRLADNDHPPYPMQIEDMTAVVADLKNKQEEYRISDEIGFVGVSAGAHLGLLWSYAFDTDRQVNFVCSVVGPTNFLDEAYITAENPELLEIRSNFNDDPEFLREVSPLFQVTASSPPTILFYGGQDPLIPDSQGIAMDERLTELNVPHEFTFYENEGHGWVGLNLLDTSAKLKAFIVAHL